MGGLFKKWKISGITHNAALVAAPMYRLGYAVARPSEYGEMTPSQKVELVAAAEQFFTFEARFKGYIDSRIQRDEQDAVKFLVMLAAVTMGIDSTGWDAAAARNLSQGLWLSMDETPDQFRLHNLPILQHIHEQVAELVQQPTVAGAAEKPTDWLAEYRDPSGLGVIGEITDVPGGVRLELSERSPCRVRSGVCFVIRIGNNEGGLFAGCYADDSNGQRALTLVHREESSDGAHDDDEWLPEPGMFNSEKLPLIVPAIQRARILADRYGRKPIPAWVSYGMSLIDQEQTEREQPAENGAGVESKLEPLAGNLRHSETLTEATSGFPAVATQAPRASAISTRSKSGGDSIKNISFNYTIDASALGRAPSVVASEQKSPQERLGRLSAMSVKKWRISNGALQNVDTGEAFSIADHPSHGVDEVHRDGPGYAFHRASSHLYVNDLDIGA